MINKALNIPELNDVSSDPSTPPSGYSKIYSKNGVWYVMSSVAIKQLGYSVEFGDGLDATLTPSQTFYGSKVSINTGAGLTLSGGKLGVSKLIPTMFSASNAVTNGYVPVATTNGFTWTVLPSANAISGTTNYLAKFNSTTSITTSSVFNSNTLVGFFTSSSINSGISVSINGNTEILGNLNIGSNGNYINTTANKLTFNSTGFLFTNGISNLMLSTVSSTLGNSINFLDGLVNVSGVGSINTQANFVIDPSVRLGVGTASPTSKLHVYGGVSSFRLEDTTQGSNKLLVSDSLGNARWSTLYNGVGLTLSGLTYSLDIGTGLGFFSNKVQLNPNLAGTGLTYNGITGVLSLITQAQSLTLGSGFGITLSTGTTTTVSVVLAPASGLTVSNTGLSILRSGNISLTNNALDTYYANYQNNILPKFFDVNTLTASNITDTGSLVSIASNVAINTTQVDSAVSLLVSGRQNIYNPSSEPTLFLSSTGTTYGAIRFRTGGSYIGLSTTASLVSTATGSYWASSSTYSISVGSTNVDFATNSLVNFGSNVLAKYASDPFNNSNTDSNTLINRGYLDNLYIKRQVVAMATVSLSLATPAISTLDGVALTIGDRILLNGQTTQSQNGIYQYNGTSNPLTRTFDMSPTSRVSKYDSVIVGSGSLNGGKLMYFDSNVVGSTISINTNNITAQAASVITTLRTPTPVAALYTAPVIKSVAATPGTRDVVYDIRNIRSNSNAIILDTTTDPNSITISFGYFTGWICGDATISTPDGYVDAAIINTYDMVINPINAGGKLPVNIEITRHPSGNDILDRNCTYQIYYRSTPAIDYAITPVMRLPEITNTKSALVTLYQTQVQETFNHPTLGSLTAYLPYPWGYFGSGYRIKILSPSTTTNARLIFKMINIS